jgi:signal peptidase II
VKRDHLLFVLPALSVILLDQISKILIAGTINHYESVKIIDGFLNLVHVRNRGMAFGLMNRPDTGLSYYFLVFTTILAVLLIFLWFNRLKNADGRLLIGLSLILGGAIGNLIDRLRLREVIDFLDFYIGSYHWPSFNLADSSITVGALWLAMNILFFHSHEKRT